MRVSVKLSEIMRTVNRLFPDRAVEATWEVKDGVLTGNDRKGGDTLAGAGLLLAGDLIFIGPESRNYGVWCLEDGAGLPGAVEDRWSGRIWLLTPPADFVQLCRDISSYDDAHPRTGLKRERFGDCEQEKSADGWERVFADRLRVWRRMYPEEAKA